MYEVAHLQLWWGWLRWALIDKSIAGNSKVASWGVGSSGSVLKCAAPSLWPIYDSTSSQARRSSSAPF